MPRSKSASAVPLTTAARCIDHARVLVHQSGHRRRVADVAGPVETLRVADPAFGHVEADDARDRLRDGPAVVVGELDAALLQQRAHQLLAEETGAAGDQDFHVVSSLSACAAARLRRRCRRRGSVTTLSRPVRSALLKKSRGAEIAGLERQAHRHVDAAQRRHAGIDLRPDRELAHAQRLHDRAGGLAAGDDEAAEAVLEQRRGQPAGEATRSPRRPVRRRTSSAPPRPRPDRRWCRPAAPVRPAARTTQRRPPPASAPARRSRRQ